MQEQYNIFRENREDIEIFLRESISNIGDLSSRESDNFKKLFKIFPSLELVYVCDGSTKEITQISDNIYRKKISDKVKGRDRDYLLKKILLPEKDISISKPYISGATGEVCITIAKKENGKIYFLDFNLLILLQRLSLLEMHPTFSFFVKMFYILSANTMILLAIFTIGYSMFDFINYVFIKHIISVESIFKPIIALTLGLAIFDLAKTVLEQEVIFKSYSKSHKNEYRMLMKFSTTIIVALLIESLMVVFKIAIDDHSNMIQAFYLIVSVSVLISALAFFSYMQRK